MKVNNKIIAYLKQSMGEDVKYRMFDYLEDVESVLLSETPDLLLVHESVGFKIDMSDLSKEMSLLGFIEENHPLVNMRYVTDKPIDSHLNQRLLEANFYYVIPTSKIDFIKHAPKNREEVYYLFDYNEWRYGGEEKEKIHKVERKKPAVMETLEQEKRLMKEKPTSDTYNQPGGTHNPTNLSQGLNKFDSEEEREKAAFKQEDETKIKYADEFERPLVSVFWSPIANVGVNSIMKAVGVTLASMSRKVLLIELDTELAKLARTTSLTHDERDIYKALTGLETNQDEAIIQNMVNKDLAIENLPFNYKDARSKLRNLPANLYVLSRNAKITKKDEPTINDESVVERMFYQAKQAGFQHILVDVPSSPNNLFTTLSFLYADERFAVIDESYGTSGNFKIAMEELKEIHFTKNDFELILNQYTDVEMLDHISEVYDMSPILEIPYDNDNLMKQYNLMLEGGDVFMAAIEEFVSRYGVVIKEKEKKKKRFALFG